MHSPKIQWKLWSKVLVTDHNHFDDCCWIWTGPRTRNSESPEGFQGHGHFESGGKNYMAHRVAYELFIGKEIPEGLVVRHNCPGGDNSLCCNGKHLSTGTQLDNIVDRVTRRRSATGTRNGAYTKPESRPRGERHRGSTITEETAALIKGSLQVMGRQYGAVPAIARHYKTTESVVNGIKFGDGWPATKPVIPEQLPPRIRRGAPKLIGNAEHGIVLSEKIVIEIRKRYSEADDTKHLMSKLAKEFGVSKITIGNILKRKTWAHVQDGYAPVHFNGHGMAKLTEDDVQTIRATCARFPDTVGVKAALSRMFEYPQTHIQPILERKLWAHVKDDPSKALDLLDLF